MKKAKLKTTKWDVVDYLKTDEDMADYLEAAIEDGDTAVISAALGDIARAIRHAPYSSMHTGCHY